MSQAPIILGIDPGKVGGWAIATDHETVVASGVAKSADERRRAIEHALGGGRCNAPVLRVVMEWTPAFGGSKSVAIGIGAARGRWLESLELTAGYSERRVYRVTPDQWRAETHGVARAKGRNREERERQYKSAACAYVGIDQPDAAEAACIALYGAAHIIGEAA